jgi:hypothetical protein
MSNVAATPNIQEDAFWWQGSLYRIKARAEDTGGALGLVEASFYRGFGPPLHVHRREDEAFYIIAGEIRFRQGEKEFVGARLAGCGDHAGCRTPSRSSPTARGRSWSSRPGASSGCSRWEACR